jgi:hypothetical protein
MTKPSPSGVIASATTYVSTIILLLLLGATTQPSNEIRQWLSDLGNSDAAVRESARDKLMGLKREDLPALAQAARDAKPLLPSQVANLHEVVRQVFLAGEPYDQTDAGFLGVGLAPQDEIVRVREPDSQEPRARLGVRVVSRWPGFAGYRWLRDGDVVVKVREFPDTAGGRTEFPVRVRARKPETTLTLEVLRQGRIIPVKITLSARPKGDDEMAIANMMQQRAQQAEDYWNTTFGAGME